MITEVIEQTIIDYSSNIVQEVIVQEETISELGQIGHGLPAGGLAGQLIGKASDADYDYTYYDPQSGTGSTPDATTTVKGKLKLAGDLSGTADLPVVVGLADKQTASQVQAIADAKVSNEAYDASTWNGVTGVAPSKGKLRDKFEQVDSNINSKQNQATYDVSQPTIALLSDTGEIVFADTNDYPNPSELTNVKGVTSPIQGQIDGKQDTLTSTNFGDFANSLTAKNTLVDADEVVSDDSADSSKAKKTSWLNVWLNFIKVKADLLYQPLNIILTNTTASFTTAQETKLGKYPSTATNGKFLQGNGTTYVEVDAPSGGGVAPKTGIIIVTSGTSFTTPADITTSTVFNIELVGAGGGGGGTPAVSGGSASGGAGGGYVFKRLTGLTPSTTYTCAIGVGGAGGASNTNGAAGTNTTLIIGGNTYRANGGSAGLTGSLVAGGAGGSSSLNGDLNLQGEFGGDSASASATSTCGKGGNSPKGWGYGGSEVSSGSNGANGLNYGGGGSGGRGSSVTGGNGTNGIIFAQWFNQ